MINCNNCGKEITQWVGIWRHYDTKATACYPIALAEPKEEKE